MVTQYRKYKNRGALAQVGGVAPPPTLHPQTHLRSHFPSLGFLSHLKTSLVSLPHPPAPTSTPGTINVPWIAWTSSWLCSPTLKPMDSSCVFSWTSAQLAWFKLFSFWLVHCIQWEIPVWAQPSPINSHSGPVRRGDEIAKECREKGTLILNWLYVKPDCFHIPKSQPRLLSNPADKHTLTANKESKRELNNPLKQTRAG